MKLQHGFAGLVFASVVMGAGVAAAGEPVERRLYSDAIDASSFLWGDWNRFVENYHPNYVGDDDPKTAWVEGVPGSGAGQWVRLQVTPLDGTTRVRLKIRNGYQKSKELFAANARAKDVVVRLLPSRAEVKATLTDSDGWQEVIVSQPVGALRAIELRVGSVYEGTKYQDLCISDVAVYASSTTADNPTFEKSKKKSLLAWRAGRIAAAKAWSSAGVALPLHASYQVTSTEGQVDCDNCDLAGMLAAAAADPAWKPWQEAIAVGQQTVAELDRLPTVQVAPRAKTALPVADGFERPDLGQVAGFEGPVVQRPRAAPAPGRPRRLPRHRQPARPRRQGRQDPDPVRRHRRQALQEVGDLGQAVAGLGRPGHAARPGDRAVRSRRGARGDLSQRRPRAPGVRRRRALGPGGQSRCDRRLSLGRRRTPAGGRRARAPRPGRAPRGQPGGGAVNG
jgi:hypothetical protein